MTCRKHPYEIRVLQKHQFSFLKMEKIVHNQNTGSAASQSVTRTNKTADYKQCITSTSDDSADDDYLNWSRDSEYSDDSFDYSGDDCSDEDDCISEHEEHEEPTDNTWMRGYLWFLEVTAPQVSGSSGLTFSKETAQYYKDSWSQGVRI